MISRHLRISSTVRRFLPLLLILYFLLLTVLLLKVPTDISHNTQTPSNFLSPAPEIRSSLNHGLNNTESQNNKVGFEGNGSLYSNDSEKNKLSSKITTALAKDQLKLYNPKPISRPVMINSTYGSFYALNDDIFIYSAYFDNRKKDIFIRFLTLARQTGSRTPIFCHFKDEIYNIKRLASRYELCENHNKHYGGYMFSCEVPEFLNSPVSNEVIVTCGESERRFIIPLKRVKPSKEKLKFLDSYIGETRQKQSAYNINTYVKIYDNFTKTFKIVEQSHKTANTITVRNLKPLSFAVCVPPLFGEIYPYRLIEFVELTLLLGAKHIFFYNYEVSDDIQKVLSHYIAKGVVTVTPWSLPSNVTSESIWYNGQLLAHNDCLYRSMPRFDLVAFNDMDEFVVPHDNTSTTWSQVFPDLITNSTCGLIFQSAFYDPVFKDMNEQNPLIPTLVTKTKDFSKIRSKVMLVPWRVFEVGIHHISKQNKENWTVRRVHPSIAFLHHYRRCDGFDIRCSQFERDETIKKQYLFNLKNNFDKAAHDIFANLNQTTLKHMRRAKDMKINDKKYLKN